MARELLKLGVLVGHLPDLHDFAVLKTKEQHVFHHNCSASGWNALPLRPVCASIYYPGGGKFPLDNNLYNLKANVGECGFPALEDMYDSIRCLGD